MSGEVEKCPILHVCPKFDVFTLDVDAKLPKMLVSDSTLHFWSLFYCIDACLSNKTIYIP